MIKIRRAGSLINCRADWHKYKSYYSIDQTFCFYLDGAFWKEIEEYQAFSIDGINKPPEIEQRELERMHRLVSRAGGLVWQFNAITDPPKKEYPEENNYVRQVAIFGEKTLEKVSKFDELVVFPYLKLKIRVLNMLITLHNNRVWFNALGPVDAIRAMERGLMVGSLDIGARKVLYKKENGQLMEKWPFYEGLTSTDAGNWKPVEHMNTWITDFEIVEDKNV